MSNWQQQLYDETMKRRGQAAAPLQAPKPQIIRQSSKQPNKTETRFELEYLKAMLAGGEIQSYDFEAITLKIANGCRYTPDWHVTKTYWEPTGIGNDRTPSKANIEVFYEIKARKIIWDDAIVKLKVAAAMYPQFEFYLCAYDSKTGWEIQRVLA